jgi:hypothetical protein
MALASPAVGRKKRTYTSAPVTMHTLQRVQREGNARLRAFPSATVGVRAFLFTTVSVLAYLQVLAERGATPGTLDRAAHES